MFPWLDILRLIFTGTVSVFADPTFWIIVALITYQYWMLRRNQLRMFGVAGYKLRQQVGMAILLGAAGGIVGSFVLTFVGVTLNQLGLQYIWPLALLLMAINMRFICFAYSGGLVALSSALFGWPAVNVPQVLSLVAGLHITESLLIAVSGRFSAVPAIVRRSDGGQAGAFMLQNFWPLPLVLLAALPLPETFASEGMVHMPDWWPLLPVNIDVPAGQKLIYAMTPVVAALGYTDIAVASDPAARRRVSALHLAGYSIILLAVAVASARLTWLQPLAAILSPLGHELLIQLDSRREMKGRPRFVPPPYGVMVLDTVPDSPARAAGLRPGDVIVGLGGYPVRDARELGYAVDYAPARFNLDLLRNGRSLTVAARFAPGAERLLGVIVVPEGQEAGFFLDVAGRSWVWEWIKRKLGKDR